MRQPHSTSPSAILSAWFDENTPWESGFLSLMRALSARTPDKPIPGTAQRPSQEAHRLGQSAHIAFAPREIASVGAEGDNIAIQLFGLGIWGAQGAMPLHLSELVWSRTEQHDHAMADFIDVFHHRALSLLWRAWYVSQDVASLDRPQEETFSFYIASLIGMDPNELSHARLPLHARLASSAHLIREARNPDGLIGALHYFFGIPVSMEEFAPHWIRFPPHETSRFGAPDSALILGDSAVLGETILDRQHKFKLKLGPLTLEQYIRFSPWGEDLPVLCEWVRNFTGYEYAWDVQLILHATEVPEARLDGSHQLGYASWLADDGRVDAVSGMSFEPEHYLF